MKYQFIDTYRSEFVVERMCRVFKVSKSGYYAWRVRPESNRARENEQLDHHIKTIYRKNKGTYGSPRITKALNRENIACSENRVARRMRVNGIKAKTKKRFKVTTNSKHTHPVAENLLGQNFKAQRPNQVWASDITYIWTQEGWLYLAVVMDLYSRRVVGWCLDRQMSQSLVIRALMMALALRKPPRGLMHHSDRGSQYASKAYRELLRQHGMVCSMSRKGNCWDNSPMERFFRSLKEEWIGDQLYNTREQAYRDLREYLMVYYNTKRLHSTLGYQTPFQFENNLKKVSGFY